MSAYDRPPLVLVDMDGVQADLEGHFWSIWEQTHPDAPQRAQRTRTNFYLEDQLPEQYTEDVRVIVSTPGFFRDLPEVDGAVDALHEMLELGWDVRVCTAPLLTNPTCTSDKLAWLDEHLGAGWSARAVIAKDKSMVRGDLLIDDKPLVAATLSPTWQHVVFDAPYNQDSASPLRLTGWSTWRQTLVPLTGRTAA